MEIRIATEVESQPEGYLAARKGVVDRQWIFTDCADDGLNLRLFRSAYRSGDDSFESPRHHHGFQQIRWTESGSVNYGPNQDIGEGDIAYFPRGTFYGPQHKTGGIGVLLQYGFDDELPRHKVIPRPDDGAEADHLRESASAETLVMDKPKAAVKYQIPAGHYEAPVLMHPGAFEYFPAGEGVEMRNLGRFFDQTGPRGDISLKMLRLSGGRYRFSADRAYIAWSTTPGLQVGGVEYPAITCLYSPRGDEAEISGVDGAEIMVVELPRRD